MEMINVNYKHLSHVLCTELGVKTPRSNFAMCYFDFL